MRRRWIPGAALAAGVMLSSLSARAGWDRPTCVAAVKDARLQAAALPAGHLSRRFAEHDLDTAILEMEAGDVDECQDLVQRAHETVKTRRYVLKPGQTLNGYRPDAPR